MTNVRLTSGMHRRPDGTIFEGGDVFEATEQELESFGDKLEPVEKEQDEWTPIRGSTGIEEPEAGEYRLIAGEHRTVDDDGNDVLLQEGDTTYLSETEAEAFADKFEPLGDNGDEDEEAGEDEEPGEDQDEESEPEAEGDSAEDGEEAAADELPEIPSQETLESDEWAYPKIKSLAHKHGIDDPNVSQAALIDFLVEQRGEESGGDE